MRRALGCAGLVLAFACGAFADFVADGNLSEWGLTPGSNWHNSIGAFEWTEPQVGNNGYVGPGYGGQTFNVEAMYAHADSNYLYYAIVTGFPEAGTTYNGDKYYPGDILFDLDPRYVPSGSTTPTGKIEFAIETTSYDSTHPHGGKTSQNQGAGSFYWDVTLALATEKWDDVYYPAEIKRNGSNNQADATLMGQTDFAYSNDYYGSSHYVIEGIVPLSFFGDPDCSSNTIWWTMTCGNDIGMLQDELPFGEVPEPGSLLLVGTGCLLAVGYVLRRRMK